MAPSGQRLGESLIWEYGQNIRIERGYAVETDKNFQMLMNDDGTPLILWRCYRKVGADDWNDELKVGKHPINGQETSINEFWLEIGKGSEAEMDALALKHSAKLKGAANGGKGW